MLSLDLARLDHPPEAGRKRAHPGGEPLQAFPALRLEDGHVLGPKDQWALAQLVKKRGAGARQADPPAAAPAPPASVEEADGGEFDAIVEQFRAVEVDADARRDVRSRADLSSDLLRDLRRSNGDMRLDTLQRTLNSMGYQRHRNQKRFHEAFTDATLPIIYGDDWNANAERVLTERGLTRVRAEVLAQAPRRIGKTVSVAMFVGAGCNTRNTALTSRVEWVGAAVRLTLAPSL